MASQYDRSTLQLVENADVFFGQIHEVDSLSIPFCKYPFVLLQRRPHPLISLPSRES